MAYQRSEHDKKYDRQMRLWGGHGQARLENGSICVLGSGAVGAEILKNLVLPSIGSFTVIDDAIISNPDFGNNFFVNPLTDIGKPRAVAIQQWLCEMNTAVKGNAIVKNPISVIEEDLNFFRSFNVVIATNTREAPLLKLAAFLYQENIPLIWVRTNGFLAHARLQLREHYINESHPSNDRSDLYLHPDQSAHFPELHQYLENTFNLENKEMDGEEHAHLPFIAILTHCMKRWRSEHDGSIPSTYNEKQEFKKLIASYRYPPPSDDPNASETNFEEAENNISRICNRPQPDSFVSNVFNDDSATHLTPTSSNFWILIRAIRDFIANEGHSCFPVSTDIPDMHTRTQYYVEIKQLYAEKASQDLACVQTRVRNLLKELGRNESDISDSEIAYFVKNVRALRCIRMSPIVDELADKLNTAVINESITEHRESLGIFEDDDEENEDEDNDEQSEGEKANEENPSTTGALRPHNIQWYLGFRAFEQFTQENGRVPGLTKETVEQDTYKLKEMMQKLVSKHKIKEKALLECAFEMARPGGAELHNIAAFMGGVVSQEALKIIIKQFVPLNNTFIYNGIDCSSSTLQL